MSVREEGKGGSRLSVNMRRGREGEEERMMGDKKTNLDTFHACYSGSRS